MKYILLFIHALTLSIYSLFLVDPVTVKTNFPASAKPGDEFTAEITINKGAIAGFAKFQLELPQGFTAKEGDSKGGAFTLSGQTAKIIWTSVPSSPEFTITMKIVVEASASGDKIVTGKYSYIENNNKQQSEIAPVTVKVEGAAVATTPTETTSTTPTETTAPTNTATTTEATQGVSVTRNIMPGAKEGEYEVELKVMKDGIKGFAKLIDKVPAGFVATAGKADGGSSFNFNSTEGAKFIWTSLPAQEQLTVSYKLALKKGATMPASPGLEGEFSYLEEQQSKKYAIARQDLTSSTTPVATNTVEPANTNTVEPTNTNTVAATNTTTTEPVNTGTTTTEPVTTQTTTPVTTEPSTTQKNSNVHYSVQVGAFLKGVNVAALSAKYSLSGVSTEMHEGYTKCIIGKHEEYRSARDAREGIKAKGVSDAFVTAYNSGKRITVQEALMITSQKWFR